MKHHPSLMQNYGPPAFNAERGEGMYLYDTTGKRYLDFGSGIAVNSVGHSHPDWVAALQRQAAQLAHCSNSQANRSWRIGSYNRQVLEKFCSATVVPRPMKP
ncbi:MAG: aminotransferase class III-fold pyridoxal phosphate-dependent enzyme [Opitutales bacterium]